MFKRHMRSDTLEVGGKHSSLHAAKIFQQWESLYKHRFVSLLDRDIWVLNQK